MLLSHRKVPRRRAVRLDVLRCLPSPEFQERVTAMLLLLIRCCIGDVAFSLKLGADLPTERLLVGFDRQEQVGPLLQAPLKNGRVVCRATPSLREGFANGEGFAYRLDQHDLQLQPRHPLQSPARSWRHTPASPNPLSCLGSD